MRFVATLRTMAVDVVQKFGATPIEPSRTNAILSEQRHGPHGGVVNVDVLLETVVEVVADIVELVMVDVVDCEDVVDVVELSVGIAVGEHVSEHTLTTSHCCTGRQISGQSVGA